MSTPCQDHERRPSGLEDTTTNFEIAIQGRHVNKDKKLGTISWSNLTKHVYIPTLCRSGPAAVLFVCASHTIKVAGCWGSICGRISDYEGESAILTQVSPSIRTQNLTCQTEISPAVHLPGFTIFLEVSG